MTTRNAVTSLRKRWPGATVPYEISATLPHAARLAIGAAILQLHINTCIRLVPRTSQRDYVLFRASDVLFIKKFFVYPVTRHNIKISIFFLPSFRCSSSVGRQGSRQIVRLSPRCYTPGIVVHEIMHALGFWHEQARADRDDHVTVLWDNVLNNMKHNFARKRGSTVQDFGTAYDYDEPCLDDHIYCAFWAEAGECASNGSFMRRFCRYSCLSCLPADLPF
ncbi:zinc metalloproteinase nas-14-like [Penaeus chinensis]|uniref:zinc metalloproteinase nas-14-like n=1 Tax=Penaeus chinensis TaxID=139456 RepID=UPI001FB6DFE0|nr:zinc metalloproteinase nas-14-like [Penaeus chinensis]